MLKAKNKGILRFFGVYLTLSFVLILIEPAIFQPVFASESGHYENIITDQTGYVDKYFEIDKDGHWKANIYLEDKKIATVDDTGTTTFPLTDHLGSPTVITNQSGTIVETNDYDAFGNVIYTTSTIKNTDKFTGKPLDNETSLQYYGARYLDNQTGRFSTIDPALFMLANEQSFTNAYQRSPQVHLANPQNLNSYSYSLNNPVNVTDKDGNIAIPAILGWIGLDFLFSINKAVAPGLDYDPAQAQQHSTNDFPSLVSEDYNNLSDSQKLVGMMLMTGGLSGTKKEVSRLAINAEEDVVKLYHGTGHMYSEILKEGFNKGKLFLTDSISLAQRYAEGWEKGLSRDMGIIDIEIPKKIFDALWNLGHIGPDPRGFIDPIFSAHQFKLDEKAIEIINNFIK